MQLDFAGGFHNAILLCLDSLCLDSLCLDSLDTHDEGPSPCLLIGSTG
jgi:hypothetical protein